MKVALSIIILSHLTDIPLNIEFQPETAKQSARFVKWLYFKYRVMPQSYEVDADKEYSLFLKEA